jgi:hypothetical protein
MNLFVVVKATERDGVTLKDGDKGELLKYTGVNKRKGLVLYYPQTVEELMNAQSMLLLDYEDNTTVQTSTILDVDINEEGQVVVTTRNTVYFLEEMNMLNKVF